VIQELNEELNGQLQLFATCYTLHSFITFGLTLLFTGPSRLQVERTAGKAPPQSQRHQQKRIFSTKLKYMRGVIQSRFNFAWIYASCSSMACIFTLKLCEETRYVGYHMWTE
jgi:hypothetical protein